MINRQMKTFELYEKNFEKDQFGIKNESWIYLKDIDVAINYKSITGVNGDIAYFQHIYTGLTNYKDFENKKQYKLICDDEFLIKSINPFTRYTQLELEMIV